MPLIKFDPTLTMEGVITAVGVILGVLGAVIGFLLDLSRRRRERTKDRRERADRLTIIEILEGDLAKGLTEDQIVERFRSPDTLALRKSLGASDPSRLSAIDFSRYLRDLQWFHLIDQLGPNIFRLRSELPDFYRESELNRRQAIKQISDLVPQGKLVEVLLSHFDKLKDYKREAAISLLGDLGTPDAIQRLVRELDSPDPEYVLASVQALARALKG